MGVEIVKSRFLKLNMEHIRYVMDCLDKNTSLIGNIRAYTLSALFNAPVTISQYYSSLVRHDMAEGFGSGCRIDHADALHTREILLKMKCERTVRKEVCIWQFITVA